MGATATRPRRRNISLHVTGTYTGVGGDNRDIDIGVNLAAKSNAYVIVKTNVAGAGRAAHHRVEHGQGDLSMTYEAGVDVADYIQSFTATGFQVGTLMNENTLLYRYIAFWTEP